MRILHSNLKLAILLATVLGVAAVASGQSPRADKAITAINEMITALGGKPFLEVREYQAPGKYFTFKRDRIATTQVFLDFVKFPDKKRREYGSDRIKPTTIISGDSGWTVYDKKVEMLPPAEVQEFQTGFKTSFEYLVRFVMNRSGLDLQLAGSELVDFKRNDIVEFRDSGSLFRLYIDQQSHLPTKLQVRREGEAFVHEEQFANWHVFQGIRTPLYIIHFRDGERIAEVRYEKLSYNPGMADSLFAPPVPPAPTAAK